MSRGPTGARTTIFYVALCFGLLTGLGEAGAYAFQRFVLHRLTFESPDVIWMAPVAYSAFFAVFALAIAVAANVARRRPEPDVVSGMYAGLGVWALLLLHRSIAPWCTLLLALGVGVRVASLLRPRRDRLPALLMRLNAVLALVIGLGGVLVRVGQRLGAPPAAAVAAADGAPNIILIILDTVRRADLSLYGYDRATTPNLVRLAAEGTVFDNAVATAPWTLPSHASILSGRLPDPARTGDWLRGAHITSVTLASVLHAHGYATGAFTANLFYCSGESGLTAGFTRFESYPVTLPQVLAHASFAQTRLMSDLVNTTSAADAFGAILGLHLGRAIQPAGVLKPAPAVTDGFLRWQQTVGAHPFFALLNYFEAHDPYSPPGAWRSRFAAAPGPRDVYDGAIAFLDAEVGRLTDSLRRRGLLDRTILVVTADHGEQFGEHGLSGHGNSLYLPLLDVPLLVRWPTGVPAGRRVLTLASLRDLAATILDLAAVGPGELAGRSLAREWRDPGPVAPEAAFAAVGRGLASANHFPNSDGPMKTIVDAHLHYIRGGTGREELYAYGTDLLELTDLARVAAFRPDLERLRAAADSLSRLAAGAP